MSINSSSSCISAECINKSFAQVKVLSDVSLQIKPAEINGLVGESGCGKTTFARILAGLEQADGGNLFLFDRSLNFSKRRPIHMQKQIQLIFQNPLASFNPKYTIHGSLREIFERHKLPLKLTELLESVNFPLELQHYYPSQLSGGQMQRAAIARALITEPRLLIADEPTSALDVSKRQSILQLFQKLRQERRISILIITHDLLSLQNLAGKISVMQNGRIIEEGNPQHILENPQNPYTQRLIASIPSLDPQAQTFQKFKQLS